MTAYSPRSGKCPVKGFLTGDRHDPAPYSGSCLKCGRPLADDHEPLEQAVDEDRIGEALKARPGGYRRLGRVAPDRPDRRDELNPIDPDREDDHETR